MLTTVMVIIPALCVVYNLALSSFRYFSFEMFYRIESAKVSILMLSLLLSAIYVNSTVVDSHAKSVIQLLLCISSVGVALYDYSSNVVGRKYKMVNLEGKVFIITGANTGIGYETAKALAGMGATIIMACRNSKKAVEAREMLLKQLNCAPSKLIVLKLDLCGFDAVRKFVKDFKNLSLPLHGLINNAGLMMNDRSLTQDGFEMVFTANHLSHFLLTNLLLPDLEKYSGRVVVLTSSLHKLATKFHFDDVMSEQSYEMFSTYAQSKLANILFAKELQKRLRVKGGNAASVKCFAVHPGCVRTEVTRHMHPAMQFLNYLFSPLLTTLQKTPAQGAYCSVYAACSPELDAVPGGDMYFQCRPVAVSDTASNMEAARMLWAISEKLTGVKTTTTSNTGL